MRMNHERLAGLTAARSDAQARYGGPLLVEERFWVATDSPVEFAGNM